MFEKSPECFKTFRIIFVTTNFWRLATSLQKEQFMVFLAAAVSFQQFLQNTTSYCDAPSSPLLECSNLSMMEGGQFPLQDFSISRWDDGERERGQKCDFLLGAQQAEAGAGFKWSSTMQKSLPAAQQSSRGPQQQPISRWSMRVGRCWPKLSSPDARMQAFGRKGRDNPRMISSRARLLRPICTPPPPTPLLFSPVLVSTLHCPLPTPIHLNSMMSHDEPRDAKICEWNITQVSYIQICFEEEDLFSHKSWQVIIYSRYNHIWQPICPHFFSAHFSDHILQLCTPYPPPPSQQPHNRESWL